MSRNPSLMQSLTPVYVEAILEDGRIMVIPAQAISTPTIATSSLSQQTIQVQQQNSVMHHPQPQTTSLSSNSILTATTTSQVSRPYPTDKASIVTTIPIHGQESSGRVSRNALQVTLNTESTSNTSEGYTSSANQDPIPENVDITNLVQTIQIERNPKQGLPENSEQQTQQPKTCMMNCGNNTLSKGISRLVTDDRCGHSVCLTCLIKSPNNCPLCQREHVSDRNQTILPKKENVCLACGKGFKRNSDLLRHGRSCHGANNGTFACPICKKNFTRASDLKRHTTTHDSEKKYVCNKCGAKFNRVENMKRHIQGHSGIKPYQCQYCKKDFSQQENLKRHIVSHTGDYQRYRCNECKKDFTRLASLRRHEHRHTGLWPYTCMDCEPPRGFSEPGLFRKHRLTHKGIKPYVCKVCSKGFNNPKAFRNHRRIHTGERPYICSICDGRFVQWGHLKRHKKIHERQASNKMKAVYRRSNAWNRRQADPAKPKLPLSAYFLWSMDARERIRKTNPHLNMPELAKACGKLWKTINKEEKHFYENKALSEREKYKKQLEEFSKRHKTKYNVGIPEQRRKSDVCVGTDAILESKEIPGSVLPLDAQDNNVSNQYDEVGNLLESAGRSIGLVPDSVFSQDNTTELNNSGNTYHPYHTSSSNFERGTSFQDFTECNHSNVPVSAVTRSSNITLTSLPLSKKEVTCVTKSLTSLSSDSMSSQPSGSTLVTFTSNSHTILSTNPHSSVPSNVTASNNLVSNNSVRFENFSTYPVTSSEDFSRVDYPFSGSPTHILDYSNRVEATNSAQDS